MQRCENGGTERGIKTEGYSPAPTVTGGHHQKNTHRYMSVCVCVCPSFSICHSIEDLQSVYKHLKCLCLFN